MNMDEIKNYRHVIEETVRFHEVDMLAVCNNAVYFNFFEDARIKYTQDIIKNYDIPGLLEGSSFFIMARNECDYIEPAFLDDELEIYTRIEFVKNSSFGFRHLVVKKASGKIITRGGGVVVHIDRSDNKSRLLPEEFYKAVSDYEITEVKKTG